MQHKTRRILRRGLLLVPVLALLWLVLSVVEWRTGKRVFPWGAYESCGDQPITPLPATVKIGLYEEFPVPWRLEKLRQVDFPVSLAIAAPSHEQFVKLRDEIRQTYPHVQEVYFWPLLTPEEGYYPGAWSDPAAVTRAARDAEGEPVLWDLELPRDQILLSFSNWWQNRSFLDAWLRQRQQPVHIWRSNRTMGLDPFFLRLVAMHFDPLTYPAVSLHLDLYMTGTGLTDEQLSRILRCGVERYGRRFIPSLGALNDGEGPTSIFVPADTFRRNLQLARSSGVQELWLFGANGLNSEYLSILHETLPLEKFGPTKSK